MGARSGYMPRKNVKGNRVNIMKLTSERFNKINKIMSEYEWTKDTQLMHIFDKRIQKAPDWIIEALYNDTYDEYEFSFRDWMKTGYEESPNLLVEVKVMIGNFSDLSESEDKITRHYVKIIYTNGSEEDMQFKDLNQRKEFLSKLIME